MWGTMTDALRQWSILVVGLVLLFGGFALGTALYPPGGTTSITQTAASEKPPPEPQHQIVRDAAPKPPPAPEKLAAEPQRAQSAPPPSTAEAPKKASSEKTESPRARTPGQSSSAHDHTAQAAPSSPPTTSGQVAAPSRPAAAAGGDAAAGRLVFRKCQACHSIDPGKNMLGPSLAGIIDRKAGTGANYNYSSAMKNADIVWNERDLDQYLDDPAKMVPGNKMPFPGLKTDHDRADVIAFLTASTRRRPRRRRHADCSSAADPSPLRDGRSASKSVAKHDRRGHRVRRRREVHAAIRNR